MRSRAPSCRGVRRAGKLSLLLGYPASHHWDASPGTTTETRLPAEQRGRHTHTHTHTHSAAGAESLFVQGLGRARAAWPPGAISRRAVGAGMLIEWSAGATQISVAEQRRGHPARAPDRTAPLSPGPRGRSSSLWTRGGRVSRAPGGDPAPRAGGRTDLSPRTEGGKGGCGEMAGRYGNAG